MLRSVPPIPICLRPPRDRGPGNAVKVVAICVCGCITNVPTSVGASNARTSKHGKPPEIRPTNSKRGQTRRVESSELPGHADSKELPHDSSDTERRHAIALFRYGLIALKSKAKREFDEVNGFRRSRLAQKATGKEMRVDRGQVEMPIKLPIRGQ